MKTLSLLIKPASSGCNMQCGYCFYQAIAEHRLKADHGLMTPETVRQLLKRVQAHLTSGDRLEIAFQGGEPTLAGLSFFQDFTRQADDLLPGIRVDYSLQTNGLRLDEDWALFFKERDWLIGLSLDGPMTHDRYRPDRSGNNTFERVMAAKQLLDEYHIDYNVLSVLTPELSNQADEWFDWLIAQGIEHAQLIPLISPLGSPEVGLRPEQFYRFYHRLIERWLERLRSGQWLHIQLIDHLIEQIGTGRVRLCGLDGRCRLQYVIEADGTLYPCDFYATDEYRLGSILEHSFLDLARTPKAKQFLAERSELTEVCQGCAYVSLCAGGCRRLQGAMYLGRDKTYCGYQRLLTVYYPTLRQIAQKLL